MSGHLGIWADLEPPSESMPHVWELPQSGF